jgi:Mn-dependent DtxR family transcriptional regulator
MTRVPADTFALTQDSLAQMLGVRRATVGDICARLQDAGIIRYSRGTMTVLDRARLEGAACECYGEIRRMFETLLPKTYEASRGACQACREPR